MNTYLRRIFYLFTAGFISLVGVLAYWQVYARESLANNPANGLQTRRAIETPRGMILAGDGETVLAKSVKQPSKSGNPTYKRVYPQGDLYSNVVGYWSVKYGATGIEIAENSNLSGTANPATVDDLINQISGGPRPGNNVTLTLDPQLQRLAQSQIAQSDTGRGSVVALDPKTGAVLAMVSYPSYDPNDIDKRFQEIQNDPSQPLLDRATQGLYIPGSIMKVITAAAALKAGVSPQEQFFDSGSYQAEVGGYSITNYGGYQYGQVTFALALAKSINTIFARIAVERVGENLFVETARRFGFEDPYGEFALPVTPSSLGDTSTWDKNDLAASAFGQAAVQTNVFEMANVAAAIANDGVMMQPQIIKEIRSPDGIILDRPPPRVKTRVLDAQTANTLTNMMRLVVSNQGTSGAARIPGVEVAGKTGTAEVPTGDPNSWFISFAPANDPKIAVAVLVENGGDGETAALPIARTLMEQYLKHGGQ